MYFVEHLLMLELPYYHHIVMSCLVPTANEDFEASFPAMLLWVRRIRPSEYQLIVLGWVVPLRKAQLV